MKRFAVAAGLIVTICGGAAGCAASVPQSDGAETVIITSELDVGSDGESSVADPLIEIDYSMPGGGGRFVARSQLVESFLADGVLVPYDGPEVFRWVHRGEVDLGDEYIYVLSEGIAEPGDFGCGERLLLGGVSYARDTFDSGNEVAFRVYDAPPGSGDAIDSEFLERLLPTDPVSYFASTGLVAPEPTAEGVRTLQLDAQQVVSLLEANVVPGTWGIQLRPAVERSGTIETTENVDGVLQQVSVRFVEIGEGRTLSDGTTRQVHREINAVLRISPLDPSEPRVSLATPRPQEGYCADLTADVPGEWDLIGPEADDAGLVIDEFGQFSGFAACQSFNGSAELAYDRLVDVELTVHGEACPEEQPYSSELVPLLLSDPNVFMRDGKLMLYEPAGVILNFRRP